MKIYPHLYQKLFATPLLLLPSTRQAFEKELLGRMGVHAQSEEPEHEVVEAETRAQAATRRMNAIMETYGSVAVVRVDGAIDKAMSDFEAECYGGCDLDDFNNALSAVGSNPGITHLVMAMNSPGGSVTGVAESAQRIAELRGKMEIHAFTESLCCSAAYWLASQADVITASPSACVGSIGVYLALLDATKALEKDGLKVNLMKAGKYKAMGAPFKELTDDERAMFQKEVDDIYAEFTSACTQLREISAETMQGQSFSGKDAVKLKLVDKVSSLSLDEYVSDLMLS